MKSRGLLLSSVVVFLCNSISVAQERFSGCGFLQNGVEAGCTIFVSDRFGQFLVRGDISPFSVGDHVYVEGSVESCITTCMQGPCLFVDSVALCTPPGTSCRQTFSITGSIVDSITGRPVDSAQVCILIDCDPRCLFEPWLCGYCDETDSLGRFQVTRTCSVMQGDYFVGTYCLNVDAFGYVFKRECMNVFIFAPCFGSNDLELQLTVGTILLEPISTGVEAIENIEVPSHFILDQNYPNPFNPFTTISFSLSSVGDVRLEIYNLIGQRIASLVSERLGAGKYEVQWDGRDQSGATVSSGIYFYRLETRDAIISKKMLLLK